LPEALSQTAVPLTSANWATPNIYASSLINRSIWNCLPNTCNQQPASNCQPYTQIVWLQSQYAACAVATCDNTTFPFNNGYVGSWNYLVCLFNPIGNYNGEHPFGSQATAVCGHNYTAQPPSAPPACANCTSGCPIPDVNGTAVCDKASGNWVLNQSSYDISIFGNGTIQCPVQILGSLTAGGSGTSTLSMTHCGKITANTIIPNAAHTVILQVDLQNTPGIVGGNYTGPYITSNSNPATLATQVSGFGVFSPYVPLCTDLVTSTTNQYIYFYNCSAFPPPNTPILQGPTLPDGTDSSAATPGPSSEPVSGEAPIITNTSPNGGGGGGSSLPWWAIVLIVFIVIIVVAVILAVIIWGILKIMHDEERA